MRCDRCNVCVNLGEEIENEARCAWPESLEGRTLTSLTAEDLSEYDDMRATLVLPPRPKGERGEGGEYCLPRRTW